MGYPQQYIKPYNEDGEKTKQVERMFDNIVHAYGKLNHTLSLGIDRSWCRKAIAWLHPFRPQHIMDIATGTGDFAILACREPNPDELIGADISEDMVNVDRGKIKEEGLSDKVSFAWEDCTSLPFADNGFDTITVTFNIRNLGDLDKDLSEMCRVLKPGRHLVILELATSDRLPMKQLFTIYSRVVIPLLDKLLSKDNSAYRYLPGTIKVSPQGEIMKGVISKTGFGEAHFRRLTFGICTLYTATR